MNRPPETVKLVDGPLDGQTAEAQQVVIGRDALEGGNPVYGLEYELSIPDPADPGAHHLYVKRAGGAYYLFDGSRHEGQGV